MPDRETHRTITKLIENIGSKEECLRLGFLGTDDNETSFVTASGLGFLLGVIAQDIDTLGEAYAAGFREGARQALAA